MTYSSIPVVQARRSWCARAARRLSRSQTALPRTPVASMPAKKSTCLRICTAPPLWRLGTAGRTITRLLTRPSTTATPTAARPPCGVRSGVVSVTKRLVSLFARFLTSLSPLYILYQIMITTFTTQLFVAQQQAGVTRSLTLIFSLFSFTLLSLAQRVHGSRGHVRRARLLQRCSVRG
jgi:hypothetical protein